MSAYIYFFACYLVSCCATGTLQALTYETLASDAKRKIFSRIALHRPLPQVLHDIAILRRVHRESHELLSDRILLKEILSQASLNSHTILEELASMVGPYYGIFNIGIKPEGAAVRPFLTDAHGHRLLPEIETFVSQPYNQEEQQALLDYTSNTLTQEKLNPQEQSFATLVLRHIESKGALLQALLVNLEEEYTCVLLNINQDHRTGFFSFRRPHHDLKDRLKKLKLILPFYYDLCACGYVPLSLPALISIQITELFDLGIANPEKHDLRAMCVRLAEVDFEQRSRQMYQDYCVELSAPETKPMKPFE